MDIDEGENELLQQCYLKSPVGMIGIQEEGGAVVGIHIERKNKTIEAETDFLTKPENDLLRETGTQLIEYFQGKRKEFTLPLAPGGTDFQRKVWEKLCAIPYGETRTYGEIAAQVGNPKACRAIGGANNKNPIMILIPCHRVIGADGSLTGYAGGVEVKEYLLSLEKRISMDR